MKRTPVFVFLSLSVFKRVDGGIVYAGPGTWDACKTFCSSLGAELFCPKDPAGVDTVKSHNDHVFLGIKSTTNGNGPFACVDGTIASFLPWMPNEPNDDVTGAPDCVMQLGPVNAAYLGNGAVDAGKWNDISCTGSVIFDCACEECSTGEYSNSSVGYCKRCPYGQYQNVTAQNSCKSCPAGLFCPEGATEPRTPLPTLTPSQMPTLSEAPTPLPTPLPTLLPTSLPTLPPSPLPTSLPTIGLGVLALDEEAVEVVVAVTVAAVGAAVGLAVQGRFLDDDRFER